jgi:hypothetical protein
VRFHGRHIGSSLTHLEEQAFDDFTVRDPRHIVGVGVGSYAWLWMIS